jgi:putative tryptophan/tyrosine transport system substrate-binding protein
MRRRELLLLGGAMTAARALRAQQKAMPVIGWLSSVSPGPSAHFVAAFRQGLSETGYVEGQNVTIEYRWAEGRDDRLPAFAADLVGRKVDLIVASGSLLSTLAAKSATSTIPIIFPALSDPVAAGLVASLARPGGNLTGFSPFQYEMMPKRLELLTELVPQARVIALLVTPNEPRTEGLIRDNAGLDGAAQTARRLNRNSGQICPRAAALPRPARQLETVGTFGRCECRWPSVHHLTTNSPSRSLNLTTSLGCFVGP